MDEEQVVHSISLIDGFFQRCGLVPETTRCECHAFLAEQFPNSGIIEPAPTQGYCSYTVFVDDCVVQFRPSNYRLDLVVVNAAKYMYGSFAPATVYLSTLQPSGLLVYAMDKMQGISYKDFCAAEHPRAREMREALCEDFAVFLARSWQGKDNLNLPPGKVGSSIRTRLEMLAVELPLRFRAAAKRVLSQLHVVESTLPWVLAHGDIVAGNIMLDPSTGRLVGLVDWAEAEPLPFGICLYGLEEIVGYMTASGFVYHSAADRARAAFWRKLHLEIPDMARPLVRRAVDVARDLGVLLWYGFAFDNGAIDRVVQEGRDPVEIRYLDALLDNLQEPVAQL
jgi:Phosphotransferase enzyme family